MRELMSSNDEGGAHEEELEAFTLHLKVSFQERLLSILPGACSAAAQRAGAEVEAVVQRAKVAEAATQRTKAGLEAARIEAEAGKVCGEHPEGVVIIGYIEMTNTKFNLTRGSGLRFRVYTCDIELHTCDAIPSLSPRRLVVLPTICEMPTGAIRFSRICPA